MSNWPHQSQVDDFYGDPRGADGEANRQWEADNIVRLAPPWKLVTAWDFKPVSSVRVHKKCSESLGRVFGAIWAASQQSQTRINEWGMQLYAGAFNFRPMRNSTRLSMHSWGCAIDFDSARNSFGDTTPNFADIPQVRDAFATEGWVWGGRWSKPDGMHWQAAKV